MPDGILELAEVRELIPQEYWIVLAKERAIEVYRRPEGGEYREQDTFSGDATIVCASVPALHVGVGELLA